MNLLCVQVPPEIENRIREGLTEACIEDIAAEGAITAALQRRAGDLAAVVVGPRVDSPVKVAEQACAEDPDLAVLLLCRPADRGSVVQDLRFSARVGPGVHCVAVRPQEPLAELVRDAAIRTSQRRQYRALLAAIDSEAGAVETLPDVSAESSQWESDERFRLIVEAVKDPIVTIDADSRIRSANPATEELFGYSPSELLGRPVTILMPESLRPAHAAGFSRYLESGERRIPWDGVGLPGLHKSGEEIPLEISFAEFRFGGTRMFTGIMRDISERKREEERLRNDASESTQRATMLGRLLEREFGEKQTRGDLAELTAKVDSGLILTEVLDMMFEAFATFIPYERMACALIEDDGQTARCVWARSALPVVEIPVGFRAPLEGSSLQAILGSGRPRILNDLEAHLLEHPDSENGPRIVSEGMRSSLTCPLISMGKPVGFLFFFSTAPQSYEKLHVENYLRIAEHLSLMVEKGRLYQELIEAKDALEARNRLLAQIFGRYTSETIVSQLLETPEALQMGGETRKVTILFADLCGFTPLCERLDPQRVIHLLNIHLRVMTEVIMGYAGTIDEFLGDAILAIFGAPVFAADDARRAVACSIAMQRAMERVNKQLSDEGLPALEMAIAVHTGTVVVGNIGSERRAKYGIVGPAVNLVTRIESRAAGGQILCSLDTLREVGDTVDFDAQVELKVKGLSEPVRAFSVRGLRDQPQISPPSRSQ